MTTAEHDLQSVIERIAQTEPIVLWEQREAIEAAIRRIEWPHVHVALDSAGDSVLNCPHCGAILNDGGDNAIQVIDLAERWTITDRLSGHDMQNRTIGVTYDDLGEFEGLAYQCSACCKPVSLPEGWIEGVRW